MGLRDNAKTGLLWSSFGTFGNGLISLIVTMVLSRLLLPEDFALIALLNVFISLSNVIVDSGFSQAVVRDDNPTKKDLSSVFFLNLLLAGALYLILFFVAPIISKFYDDNNLTLYSRVVFLVILFNALIVIQVASLKRALDFKSIEKASVYGSFIAGTISIVLAFLGVGIWALISNMVLMPLFRCLFIWIFSSWRPSSHLSILSLKKYFSFGIFLTLQSAIDIIVSNLNTILIGKVYSKRDLGYYSQGVKLDSYIVAPLNSVLNKVVFPITAKVKNDSITLKEAYSQISSILLCVIVPILLFVSVNAENTIIVLFGEKWRAAGVYLQLHCILNLFQIIQTVFYNAILVKGKTKILFYFTIIKEVLRIVAILLTMRISVYAMVIGYTISGIIGSCLYIGLGLRCVDYSFLSFIKDNSKTLIATFLSLILTTLIIHCSLEWNLYFAFAVQLLTMFLAYILINLIVKNKNFKECTKLILSFIK